jgi:flagellar biosynthetic protein FliR
MTPDLAGLAELVGIGHSMAQAGLLVFLRIGAALALLPAFGEQSVPQRVRLVVALAFTAAVLPVVAPAMPPEPGLLSAATEVTAGLALGAVFRLFILALQIAGSMIAQATSLSQIAGGAAPDPLPAVGHLLTAAGLALAVMSGLHIRLAEAFILSYQVLPAGSFPGVESFSEWGVAHVAHAFRLAFTLAMPFTIAALMYNMALGAINRAMPSLMVAFIGAPALSGAGLILIAILSPLLLSVWSGALLAFMDAPFAVPK